MKLRFALAPVVASVLLFPSIASAQAQDDAVRKDIVKLLDLTGSTKMGVQMASMLSDQFLDGLRKTNPDIPAKVIDIAKQLLNEEFTKAFEAPDGLTPQLVTIYSKHFTHDEVLGLIRFYETELGKKTVAAMPQIMQEAGGVGQQWAVTNVPRIMESINSRLKAEGYIK